jgi:hypothetical protein
LEQVGLVALKHLQQVEMDQTLYLALSPQQVVAVVVVMMQLVTQVVQAVVLVVCSQQQL